LEKAQDKETKTRKWDLELKKKEEMLVSEKQSFEVNAKSTGLQQQIKEKCKFFKTNFLELNEREKNLDDQLRSLNVNRDQQNQDFAKQ